MCRGICAAAAVHCAVYWMCLGRVIPECDARTTPAPMRVPRYEMRGTPQKHTNNYMSAGSLDAKGWFNRGARAAAHGRHHEAVFAYQSSLRLGPQSLVAQENLGIALADCGRKREAASAFGNAIALAPSRHESYSLLARILYEVGDASRGANSFASALELAPGSAALHH